MAAPKKDAFADLFQSAAGTPRKKDCKSSMNDLSMKRPLAPLATLVPNGSSMSSWSNLDMLSPNIFSNDSVNPSLNASVNPSLYGSVNPSLNGSVASTNGSVNGSINPSVNSSINPSVNVSRRLSPLVPLARSNDPLSVLGLGESLSSTAARQSSSPSLNGTMNNESLLDDDFTDAFVAEKPRISGETANPTQYQEFPTDTTLQNGRKKDYRNKVHGNKVHGNKDHGNKDHGQDSTPNNDTLLAELVDIGFSVEDSNEAIRFVGEDLQDCVNYIMNKKTDRPSRSDRHRDYGRDRGSARGSGGFINDSDRSLPDLNAKFNDVSNKLYNTASWFLDKSKKTVIGGISNLQQQHINNQVNDGRPAWMKSQYKYKDGALEKKHRDNMENYGTDEENIDTNEIQRIIAAQQKRERERQRERLSRSSQLSPAPLRENSTNLNQTPSLPMRKTKPESERVKEQVDRAVEGRDVDLAQSSKPNTALSSRASSIVSQRSLESSVKVESVDLLGLLSDSSTNSPAQRFKQMSSRRGDADSYSLPSRRRPTASKMTPVARNSTNETLNAFQQSDYETNKAKGYDAFTRGDFHDALEAYTKCLAALPEKHELKVVIDANTALTAIKLGNYRYAVERCEEGMELVGDAFSDTDWTINNKSIKYWYIKLLMRKAESLELMERFSESLECYMLLITKHNVSDLKVMEAKRRIGKIVKPPKEQPKPQRKVMATAPVTVVASEKVNRIKKQHEKERKEEELKFQLHDQVHERTTEWSKGKENNIRALLMSLSEVLPQRLGFAFITTKVITMNDLMLTKKVKVNYMRVISSIHPDKLESLSVEDRMICQLVFVTLNKAWDEFKVQNNIA